MAALIHRRTITIEHGQCDSAGLVFYPNYLIMFDASTGLLFARTGLSLVEMRERYGIVGLPLVEQGIKFFVPCRAGEELIVESEVGEWGRSNFTVRHRVMKGNDMAVEGFEKRVWAIADPERLGRIKPEPIPREVMASLSDPTGATRIAGP